MIQPSLAIDRLYMAVREKDSRLCLGLDPRLDLMPVDLRRWAVNHWGRTPEAVGRLFVHLNEQIIDSAHEYVVMAKPQIGFYEPYAEWGIWAYGQTLRYARKKGLLTTADTKRCDGDETALSYARTYLGRVPFWGEGDGTELTEVVSPSQADFMTVGAAYVGSAGVVPFVEQCKAHGNGIFVVVKTSYRPNSEVEQLATAEGTPVWEAVAKMVSEWGCGTEGQCGYRNVGAVLGATYPGDAPRMRRHLGKSCLLLPGYGGQDATADDAVAGFNDDGFGGVVNSSRALMYAYCYRDERFQGSPEEFARCAGRAAKAARDEINDALARAGKLAV